MLYYGQTVLLLECLMRQAHADASARCGYSDIETEDAAVRIRQDAREFLDSVQSAYIEIRDAAGAVMEVVYRRRLAGPMVYDDGDLLGGGEKRCTRCGVVRETIEFSPITRDGRSGWDSWCRSCRREYKRSRVGQTRSVDAKWCPDCEQTLAASEFHTDRSRYDGLYTYCHVCKAARARAAKRRL